jgi:hypothetical protein
MLNFAERTGSGVVMLVWSFPQRGGTSTFIISAKPTSTSRNPFFSRAAFGEVLLFACGEVLQIACGEVLLFACGEVLLFACGEVLLFACGDVLLFACGEVVDSKDKFRDICC